MSTLVDPIDPTTTVAVAAQMMRDANVGCLVVGRDDQLFGIVTDRDIMVRALADGRSVAREQVWSVMSSNPLCCFEDQASDEAARLMEQHGVRRLPVLDRTGRLTGLVSLSDIRGGASSKKPYAATFYKGLPDGRGTLHDVPLGTVYVAGVASEAEPVGAAEVVLERAWNSHRWRGAADGCRVERSH
jgi:CBS-domain-containing membrane protein